MYPVYRIDRNPVSGNSHGVCRDERWKITEDRKFSSKKEAEDYVVDRNFHFCAYDLGLSSLDDENIKRSRCLDDQAFIHRRLYHITYPDMEKIASGLLRDGVKVIEA